MTLKEFKIPDYPLYVSIEQQLRNDAHKYTQRAQVYITQHKLDCAIGCLNKAINKINRADMLKLTKLEETAIGMSINKISEAIAKEIMEGK